MTGRDRWFPGHPNPRSRAPAGHCDIARRCGLGVELIPVDSDGLDTALLGRERIRAVVVTRAHEAPTGVALAANRRPELVDWARHVDGFVMKDDDDAELRYDRQPDRRHT